MIYVLESILNQQVVRLWHKDRSLQGADLVVVPGGFSYGDYLRSGAIARFAPIMNEVRDHANRGGLVFGVCNGFQILCEAALLPGTLQHNLQRQFLCANVHVKAANESLITAAVPTDKPLKIPIAHGEGRYYAPAEMLDQIEQNNQVIFRYCTARGEVSEGANPNGSVNNIAGVCNRGRNVFGMMPHPERAADDELLNTDGRSILEGLLQLAHA